jgi:hypothetical protein
MQNDSVRGSLEVMKLMMHVIQVYTLRGEMITTHDGGLIPKSTYCSRRFQEFVF